MVIGLAVLAGLRRGARAQARRGSVPRAGAAAGRELAADPRARRSTTSCCGTASPPPGRTRPSTSTRNGGPRRWCCPASSTPTTTGAGRSTRSCPSSPTRPVGDPQRRRLRRPARDRPAVDGRRAGPAAPGGPGQLDPLLDLLGARTVIAGADDDRTRSGAAPAAEAADVLDAAGPPRRGVGPASPAPRRRPTLGAPRALPAGARLRPADRARARARRAAEPGRVVDGSAEGVAALAAFERSPGRRPTPPT